MLYSGAGLADNLVLKLGLPVDLVAVRGSGATPAASWPTVCIFLWQLILAPLNIDIH